MRNLTLTASGGLASSTYPGVNPSQDVWQYGLKAEYSLTRALSSRGLSPTSAC